MVDQHYQSLKNNLFSQKEIHMKVKEEISNIVDTLPEEFLDELLQYLIKLEKSSKDKVKLSLHLNTILTEDKDVLSKLAE